jgi:hypothetical protein
MKAEGPGTAVRITALAGIIERRNSCRVSRHPRASRFAAVQSLRRSWRRASREWPKGPGTGAEHGKSRARGRWQWRWFMAPCGRMPALRSSASHPRLAVMLTPPSDHHLRLAAQAGATDVVAAYPGQRLDDLIGLRDSIASCGLNLTVIERGVPHDQIVHAGPRRREQLADFRELIENLGRAGVGTLFTTGCRMTTGRARQ